MLLNLYNITEIKETDFQPGFSPVNKELEIRKNKLQPKVLRVSRRSLDSSIMANVLNVFGILGRCLDGV